ncbi:MAG: enoyl-CoA hydratase/isomerase family protein [Emcibacter sp.]|nr:enoyl-CoA hydratase/isomerase family protein [Emcibacter sp.]
MTTETQKQETTPQAAEVLVKIDQPIDGITVLTLNRPRARNAVSFDLWQELDSALNEAESASPPRAIIITGAENFFCAGGDLKTPPSRGDAAMAPAARLELGQRVLTRLRNLPVPVIAAVEGGAYGIGWSLALACDMIIAADQVKFCAPFLSLGLIPDGGFVWLLRRQIGLYKASEIIYSERVVMADEAFNLGLVSHVVPTGTAIEAALAFADKIGKGNQHSVQLTKRLLQAAENTDLKSHNALELGLGVICQTGPEVALVRTKMAAKKKNKG